MTIAEQPRETQRERKTKKYVLATLIASIVYTLLVGATFWLSWLLIPTILAAGTMIGFAFMWMRSLDEAKQQAHYVAWYWGGSAGLSFSALVVVAMMPLILQPEEFERAFTFFDGVPAAPMSFLAGFALGLAPAVVGYLIWWTVMWLKRN
jgi:hypothetical protein